MAQTRRNTAKRRSFVVAMSIGAIFAFVLFFVLPAYAQDAAGDAAAAAGLAAVPLPVIIGRVIGVILGLAGIILLGLIIYAGFTWMTAGGNADKVAKAKRILINAVVGLLIVLASFAITNFVVSAITGGQGIFGGGAGTGTGVGGPGVSTEPFSGSFGTGVIRDHYPGRGQTGVPRNTKIFVTFKDAMNIESFISDYSTQGTPFDRTDDTVGEALNTDNVLIYATEDGEEAALSAEDVRVSFTDNLKTFVFSPPVLGNNTENVQYSVALRDTIENIEGDEVLNSGGYIWQFTVSTEVDLDPPTVTGVTPRADGTYDRNIVVEIDFDEAVDPTSASGVLDPTNVLANFDNIQVAGSDGEPVPGTFAISNGYRTVTYTTSEMCGTNSCGEEVFCLPANDDITVTVRAATPGLNPPQTDTFPYNGVVDISANALDGNGDGVGGDDYTWRFQTTDDINLAGPRIVSINPAIMDENVALDQPITIEWDSIMDTSSLSSESVRVETNPTHELWYNVVRRNVTSAGEPAVGDAVADHTVTEIQHGVFLESNEDVTYMYGVTVEQGARNEYQNCYRPAEGPGSEGGTCGTSNSAPFCCNGTPSSTECLLF